MSIRIAVLASGSGSTLQNLIDRSKVGRLSATIAVVISDVATAGALERAKRAGIPGVHVEPKGRDLASFSREIFDACRHHRVDLVVMGGFLRLATIPPEFTGRVINVHPSLIPAFCGKGYYGERVHQAVLDRGVKVTGCTVHFCDNEYDHGPIISQRAVEVYDGDTAHDLALRVQEAEREALPEVIDWIAAGRVRIEGRRTVLERGH